MERDCRQAPERTPAYLEGAFELGDGVEVKRLELWRLKGALSSATQDRDAGSVTSPARTEVAAPAAVAGVGAIAAAAAATAVRHCGGSSSLR